MLQGALIGAFVSVIIIVFRLMKQRNAAKSVLAGMTQGNPQAARAQLDQKYPAVQRLSTMNFQDQIERICWVAILGDVGSAERELQAYEGGLNLTTQVRAFGYAALLAHRTDARDIQSMAHTLHLIESEGGMMLGVIKKMTRDFASVAKALNNEQPIDADAVKRLTRRAAQMGPGAKIAVYRYVSRALDSQGQNGAEWATKADDVFRTLTGA